ncbi:hypothetical protein RSAG8_13184, partial [Rhizoctonia solani AG-8 WAC10335]
MEVEVPEVSQHGHPTLYSPYAPRANGRFSKSCGSVHHEHVDLFACHMRVMIRGYRHQCRRERKCRAGSKYMNVV